LLSRLEIGVIELLELTAADVPAISAILTKYQDQGFDLADACLMHLADREGITHVFTIDRRHFSVFQAGGGRGLTLLPPE
jgi:predicted nucleic acid-binding protein